MTKKKVKIKTLKKTTMKTTQSFDRIINHFENQFIVQLLFWQIQAKKQISWFLPLFVHISFFFFLSYLTSIQILTGCVLLLLLQHTETMIHGISSSQWSRIDNSQHDASTGQVFDFSMSISESNLHNNCADLQ